MSDVELKGFVIAFTKFLKSQTISQNLAADTIESIEVAIQCLEAAYNIVRSDYAQGETQNEINNTSAELLQGSLFELFRVALLDAIPDKTTEAEKQKQIGNELMKESKFCEALNYYNRAISLDATNPVFYCNRAAAYIRLNEFEKAVADCKMSLAYNPNYSKAYGRLGIAYTSLKKIELAREAYEKALALEPNNTDYQNNLRIANANFQSSETGHGFLNNLPHNNPGIRNLLDILNDPAISMGGRQIATQIMNDYPDAISYLRDQLTNVFPTGNSNDGRATGNTTSTGQNNQIPSDFPSAFLTAITNALSQASGAAPSSNQQTRNEQVPMERDEPNVQYDNSSFVQPQPHDASTSQIGDFQTVTENQNQNIRNTFPRPDGSGDSDSVN